jgi:NIMA-interacting peptidyl-prolyl cis-trans isomerase 1
MLKKLSFPFLQRTGVSIDGHKIPPNKPTKFKSGSRITIGPQTYVLHCEAAPAAAAATTATAPTTALTPDPVTPTHIRASHLLVKHRDVRNPRSWKEPEVTRSKEEALAMIEAFQDQLRSGQADFAALASVESHCSSAKRGGDLGMFGKGQMMKAFEEPAFALKIGEMSGPVFSDSGVHLILRTG